MPNARSSHINPMKIAKRSKKGRDGNEPSVLDYFSKSKRTPKPQTRLPFGTPVTHTWGGEGICQSETPASVTVDSNLLRGRKRAFKNAFGPDSEEGTPDSNGSSRATPTSHEPNTPPSPPASAEPCVFNHLDRNTDEWRSATKSARSTETPPSHDTHMTTPPSPPTPAGTTWRDYPILNGKENQSHVNRENPRGSSSKMERHAVDTPKSLLDTKATPAQIYAQGKSQRVNMDTPSTVGHLTPKSTMIPPSKFPETRQVDESTPLSKQQGTKCTKQQKQSTKQLFLDFGQNSFGKQTICSICGMLRVHGMPEDDAQHAKICKEYKEGVACFGWKNERRVAMFKADDKILEVRADDPQQHRKKIIEVKNIVDSELGFARRNNEESLSTDTNMTSFFYISKKRVVGLLMVKRIRRAYELLPSEGGNKNNDNTSSSISRSLKSSKALLGIHQIWVHKSHRSRGIASKLVTAARDNLIFGMMIPLELVAFSSPTDEGLRFAKRYLGSEKPLIYDIH